MKSKKISILLAVLALTTYSCSTEESVVSTPAQTRDTQSTDTYIRDENILQNYVRINKNEKQYYMDYQQSPAAVEQIDPNNKVRFENRLNELNLSIKQAIQNTDQSIYLQTRNDHYFSDNDASITAVQNTDVSDITIAYLDKDRTNFSSTFYSNNQKIHSIIRVNTVSYDEPIQMTINLQNAVAGKGTTRTVFIASPLRVVNALINWTYQQPLGSHSPWPLNVTKNKSVSGTISFFPEHIGSLATII